MKGTKLALFFPLTASAALLAVTVAMADEPKPSPDAVPASAIERMSQVGPEAKRLAASTGTWDVVFTFRPAPNAQPMLTRNLVAERTMIGPFLQEILKPKPGSGLPDFQRIDYLGYDRVEGRWKYVSMDTRFPAGIMPAWSFGGEQDGKIVLQFEPLGFVGMGEQVEGRLLRSDMVFLDENPDLQIKRQRFILADGTGTAWPATEYEYRRRK